MIRADLCISESGPIRADGNLARDGVDLYHRLCPARNRQVSGGAE
jgi:hypothetical protein